MNCTNLEHTRPNRADTCSESKRTIITGDADGAISIQSRPLHDFYRYFAKFANFVSSGLHISCTVPIGPLRCLAMITSAIFGVSVSLL